MREYLKPNGVLISVLSGLAYAMALAEATDHWRSKFRTEPPYLISSTWTPRPKQVYFSGPLCAPF